MDEDEQIQYTVAEADSTTTACLPPESQSASPSSILHKLHSSLPKFSVTNITGISNNSAQHNKKYYTTSSKASKILVEDDAIAEGNSHNVFGIFEAASNPPSFDPLSSPDWDAAGPPGFLCAGRVKKDLCTIFNEPLPGIFVAPEENNLFKVHCLIIGPFDTPYEGGFFHFLVRFGPQYPLHPPRVKFLTTGGENVRFNPNLYKNGKVCLSILGTWSGPPWSPASNLSSVLLSLQSILNEKPYHNEPGHEKEHHTGASFQYNQIISHESIRVSVIGQLDGVTFAPPELVRVMEASFLEYYDHYVEICESNLHKDGQAMNNPFGGVRGLFMYKELIVRLNRLKARLQGEVDHHPPDESVENADEISSVVSSISDVEFLESGDGEE